MKYSRQWWPLTNCWPRRPCARVCAELLPLLPEPHCEAWNRSWLPSPPVARWKWNKRYSKPVRRKFNKARHRWRIMKPENPYIQGWYRAIKKRKKILLHEITKAFTSLDLSSGLVTWATTSMLMRGLSGLSSSVYRTHDLNRRKSPTSTCLQK